MCAPSNAGPDAVEQLHSSPSRATLISVFVPMSIASVHRVPPATPPASSIATWSPPTYPAITGGLRQPEVARVDVERGRLGRNVWRGAELAHSEPGEQVVHRRIADDDAVDD